MTKTGGAIDPAGSTRELSRREMRLTAVCGGLFAITFGVALLLLADLLGSFADSDGRFEDYFANEADRNGSAIGGSLLFVSAIALMPFAGGFVRTADAGLGSERARLAIALSYVASGLVSVSAAALATVGASRLMADLFDESSLPFQGSSIAVLPQLGYVLMVFGAWTTSVILALAGSLILKMRVIAPAIGWSAFVCAAVLIFAPAVAPLVVLPIWALSASVALVRLRNE